MFKYESGQLPDALNMFFSLNNRSVHNYNTRNKDKLHLTVAKHAYRDRDFRLVGVHGLDYITVNIKINTSFSTFKKALKIVIQSEKLCFNLKL